MHILKQYNLEVAKFNLMKNKDGRCVAYDFSIIHEELLPLDLVFTSEGIGAWLKNRIIPSNRKNSDLLLGKLGLGFRDTIGIINICKGLSLNDSYWVVDDSFEGDFYKYNLYTHNINRILLYIAFTGYGSNSIRSSLISSPEFTTNGMLAKCWRRIDGDLFLYKSGTSGASNTGKEPYSEYYAYQIANAMGVNAVEYNLSKWKGSLCSTCKLFTDIDVSFIPSGRLIKEKGVSSLFDFYEKLGTSYLDNLVSIFVFDAIVYNTDRHYGNFGFLIDNKTNAIIDTAPIFDNGLSLFNYALDEDLANFEAYSKSRYPALYDDFVGFIKPHMTENQRKQVRKLIGFKFKKHPRYNLSDKRLKMIENIIQNRVLDLLK